MATAEQQLEHAADRLIAHHPRSEYPCYPEEYLRRKSARHRECYLEECYSEPVWSSYDGWQDREYVPTAFVRILATLFRLAPDLVADILAGDPTAGLPSSWPDADALKRARGLPNVR